MASNFMTAAECERFISHVEVLSEEECWNWKKTILQSGYGQFSFRGKGVRAHRVAYRWHYGEIPEGRLVLHRCINNRRCCNPAHLYLGNEKDNADDCGRQGRRPKGESHKGSRITADQVREIRRRYFEDLETQGVLAEAYGVSKGQIAHICRRLERGWAWLETDEVPSTVHRKRGPQKLTDGQVQAIRKFLSAGVSCTSLAAQYGVCIQSICNIRDGKTYRWVKDN